MLREAMAPLLTGKVDDWRTEYAYTTGMQAFIYGFPYIYNARLRHDWITKPRDPAVIPYAPVSHFWHASSLVDATYRDGGCPNNDTMYSLAWVDLSREPVVLSHPNMGNRYFTFELMAFTSDNFDYVGQRTTGKAAGHFAITGPGWKGRLPAGVKKTQPSPTPWILVLGRTLVDGQDDLPKVRALQEQYKLTPLSKWGKPRARVPRASRRLRAAGSPPGPARAVEEPERDAGREPPACSSRTPAEPVRAHRHRPWARCRGPARGRQARPDPGGCDRDAAAAPAIPQRRVGDRDQRLALPARRRKAGSATTSCGGPLTSRWLASRLTTRPRPSTW